MIGLKIVENNRAKKWLKNEETKLDSLEYDFNLATYFTNPQSQRQKQYEAIRAIVLGFKQK